MSNGIRAGSPETRDLILAATWKLMGQSKDLQVRIADIAKAAGLSRQAVYLHFGTRANLLLAAVQYRDLQYPTLMIKRAAEEDPLPDALATFVERWFEHIPRIQPVAMLLSAASLTDEDAQRAWDDRMTLLRHNALTLARRLARAGLLQSRWTAPRAADWIWHRTHLDGWRHIIVDRQWSLTDYTRLVVASLQRDLLVET